MNKLKAIAATLSRPSSFNRARSVSFCSSAAEFVPFKPKIRERFQVADKDLESEENLMDLYERWMRHFGRTTTDMDEKNRRFQTFKDKVMEMDLDRHRTLTMSSDSSKEDIAKFVGCNLPSLEAQSEVTSPEDWDEMVKLEGGDLETYDEMEQRLFGQVSSCSSAEFVPFEPDILESFQVTHKDLESEENLMDLYERWMRHFDKITTDIDEKNRRFQTFKDKVMKMDLMKHSSLGVFADTSREEIPNWLGCKLPTLKAQSEVMMSLEDWREKVKLEDRDVETYEEMERRLFGQAES